MKKIFAVLTIAVTIIACNNAAETTEAKMDSAATATMDSVHAVVDSASAKIDSTIKAATDTLAAKIDSLKK